MEGKPFCWGSNARGELGDGSKHSIYVKEGAPKSVSMAEEVKSITTGEKFTCALSIDDDGFCWGENIDGELGVGTMKDLSLVPMKVKASWKWKEITCGIYSCCGRGKDGRVHCWGAWSTAEARYETRTEPYPIAGDWSTSRSSFSRSALNVFTAIVVILLLITAVKQVRK
jgi:alpha-tubulin suppressor-like RCC1 family protein